MDDRKAKESLHRHLREAREAILWKLDGSSEYDGRRPITPHGTNLLGLVKHLATCEIGYFGATFDRPFPDPPAWLTSTERDVDMWAHPDETRADIVALYRRATSHADETIEEFTLDHPVTIPGWRPDRCHETLHGVLVHMIAETNRHAGHADVVRELIDGTAGRLPSDGEVDAGADYWQRLVARIDTAARVAAEHRGV
ncbi:DinB family protein [Gordonia sp. CPCC 206044]|uniref:DinB family protein n=1 Tax=Gordonia sp. CPCC 206044 TaxID=3140793 RepID=UPI003AF3D17E